MKQLKTNCNAHELSPAKSYDEYKIAILNHYNGLKSSIVVKDIKTKIQICYRFTKLKTLKGSFNVIRTGRYCDYAKWTDQLVHEYPEYFDSVYEVVSYSGKKRRFDDDLVYFITDGIGKYVKIGYTNNLDKRIGGIETGNPHGVKCLAVMDGGKKEEQELHFHFDKYHHFKEWFHLEGELLDFINGPFCEKIN